MQLIRLRKSMYFLHFIYRNLKTVSSPTNVYSDVSIAGSKGCRFRPGLHGSGQIIKQTSSLLHVQRVYTKPCKFCYRLQHCLHESTQICRPLKNLHGGSTSPMSTKDGSVQVFVSSCKRDLSLIIFACFPVSWLSLNHCPHLKNLRDFLTIQFYY